MDNMDAIRAELREMLENGANASDLHTEIGIMLDELRSEKEQVDFNCDRD